MQRITISLEDELADALDTFLNARGYQSRSEGIRDLVREAMTRPSEVGARHSHCVANLSYIYNHRVRALASKLADFQHAHHDLIASTTLMHLDHDNSLESVMLKGRTKAVLAFSHRVGAERGVRSNLVNLIGVKPHDQHHEPHDHEHHGHDHLSPVN
jgi:CopG family nickel-responsive transcriptional regulator